MTETTITEMTQYLTFRLAEEVYALDIAKVREVLDFTTVTKVPRTPEFMRGVINLRGSVVPVVDLRLKFGMSITEVTVDTDTTVLGVLADAVQEVMDLQPEDISAPPKIGTKLRTEFITGMGKREDRFIILLDIDKVFSVEDLSLVQAAEKDAAGE
jgi:purine-binding chemotaxis protein CheW